MGPSMQGVSRPPHIHYVSSPMETVNNMNKLLLDYEKTPFVMEAILADIGLHSRNPDEPEVRERIGEYLVRHEEYMKTLFLSGDPQERDEIVRIYRKYIPHHTGF